jgi:DNA-directed RNA polymerase subunit RPC12/RpoP
MPTHHIPVQVGNHQCTVDIEQVRTEQQVEGPKRLRLPYTLKWACPNCGHEREDDYGCGEQFECIMIPATVDEHLGCPECDFEFVVKIKLGITMEIVT